MWHLKKRYVRGAGDFPTQAYLERKFQKILNLYECRYRR